jgi:hypothetical protein
MPVSVSKGGLTSRMNFLEAMGPASATEVANKFAGCTEFRQPTSIRGICRAPRLPPRFNHPACVLRGFRLRPAPTARLDFVCQCDALALCATRACGRNKRARKRRWNPDGTRAHARPATNGSNPPVGPSANCRSRYTAHSAAAKAVRREAAAPQRRRGPVRTCFRVSCDRIGQHR